MLAPERIETVAQYMCNITFDKASFEWSRYKALSHAFKRNLRHLFAELAVAGRIDPRHCSKFLPSTSFHYPNFHTPRMLHAVDRPRLSR